MNKKILSYALAASAVSGLFLANPTFAKDYGIVYEGGTILDEKNINIDPTLIDNLIPLLSRQDTAEGQIKVEPAKNYNWTPGYIRINETKSGCKSVVYNYIKPKNNQVEPMGSPSYRISNDKYTLDITITGESFVKELPEGKTDTRTAPEGGEKPGVTISVGLDNGWIYGGWDIYTDEECKNINPAFTQLKRMEGEQLFVETELVFRSKDNTIIPKPIYFGLLDIDHAQSFMIRNANNYISKENTYAKSEDLLQNDIALKQNPPLENKYVEGSTAQSQPSYIYSMYDFDSSNDSEANHNYIDIIENQQGDGADIYVKLADENVDTKLYTVFGFAKPAGSVIEYYTEQLNVEYKSDANGKITGKTDEKRIYGENPTGSTSEANKGYKFVYWTANVDVKLKDGTEIKAGAPLTPEQVKNVVVEQKIVFTAIHEDDSKILVKYESDENGKITGKTNETVTAGQNPTGSTSEANKNYKFDYWKADIDVKLKDGTTIKAGSKLTAEQVKQVVVEKPITFTAIHVSAVKAPDTGLNTSDNDNNRFYVLGVSTASLLAVAALAKYAHDRISKSVKFKK